MKEDQLYKIALTLIPNVGPMIAKNLISHCGGAKNVFESSRKKLMKIPLVGSKCASTILKSDILEKAKAELEFMEKHDIRTLFYLDDDYPDRLKHYDNAPFLMYYRGNVDLNKSRIVGIVGTRQPTVRGITNCEKLVEGLAPYNVLVVSGLAYGIDGVAHKKSVEYKIPTVGVMGTGMASIYPHEHKRLANQMVQEGGLLSEYPHQSIASRQHFPMRNRIIAGMVDALVVVESKKKGGSMISAIVANEYNKNVFAFAGRSTDEQSEGCNFLIKNHQAQMIDTANDLVEIMRWEQLDATKEIQKQMFVKLNEEEASLVALLKESEEVSIDKITYELKKPSSEIASLLLTLEFKGMVKTLPGKRYALC